jgi:hypothetical protein
MPLVCIILLLLLLCIGSGIEEVKEGLRKIPDEKLII